MKDDRLRVLGTPVLEEDVDAVGGGDKAHDPVSFLSLV
jgi:hypothetical protein